MSRSQSLFGALQEEVAMRSAAQMRGGQWVTGACAICALIASTRGAALSLATLALAAVVFAFFTAGRLASGKAQRVVFAVTPAFVLSIPSALVLIIAQVTDVEHAFASWLVPSFIAFLTTLSVLRLEPWRPIAYAGASSALYLVTYVVATWGIPWEQRLASVTLAPSVQAIRVIFFVGSGLGLAMIARAMREALERAERKTRARVLFGKYRLGAPIATGGMATVVQATYCPEGGFERPVAVKRVHTHLAKNPRIVELFRNEAELGARLAHPNIAAVLDFGRIDDTWFIAMEHVVGLDVRKLLNHLRRRARNRPPREAVLGVPSALVAFIGAEALAGLAFAHGTARDRHGRLMRVVHRDLSPGNVLLSATGEVKVTDFGIATPLLDHGLHRTQRLMGSMAYLSPEQAAQGAFDHRADLFALAALLYEMLTLTPLFKRATTAATLMAVLHDRAPPLPPALANRHAWERFFAQALAKDPDRRFATAKEMALALANIEDPCTACDLAAFLTYCGALEGPGDDVTTPVDGDDAPLDELHELDATEDIADRDTFLYEQTVPQRVRAA